MYEGYHRIKKSDKIEATRLGFESMFPNTAFTFEGFSVPSDVSNQPMSNDETYRGAINRANNAKLASPDADYWVGIEGGLQPVADELEAFAWVAIASHNRLGKGRTGTFFLPPKVAELIYQGMELGDADDIVFAQENSKQKSGAVGILTQGRITRTTYYEPAVIFALIPFISPDLYS